MEFFACLGFFALAETIAPNHSTVIDKMVKSASSNDRVTYRKVLTQTLKRYPKRLHEASKGFGVTNKPRAPRDVAADEGIVWVSK